MLEHVHPVIIQMGALLRREFANTHARVYSPRIKQLVSDLWDDEQFLVAGERDVALVEQMIDVRGQQQTIGAVEALGVRRITPRLDVTGFEVSGLADMRNAAGIFT